MGKRFSWGNFSTTAGVLTMNGTGIVAHQQRGTL